MTFSLKRGNSCREGIFETYRKLLILVLIEMYVTCPTTCLNAQLGQLSMKTYAVLKIKFSQ